MCYVVGGTRCRLAWQQDAKEGVSCSHSALHLARRNPRHFFYVCACVFAFVVIEPCLTNLGYVLERKLLVGTHKLYIVVISASKGFKNSYLNSFSIRAVNPVAVQATPSMPQAWAGV